MIIHDKLGFIVVVLAVVGAAATIISLLRPAFFPTVRVYLLLMTGVVALQVVVGLVLVLTGSRPSQLLHWFYGAATLVSMPLFAWLGRGRPERQEHLWLVAGAVATMLFALRALTTG